MKKNTRAGSQREKSQLWTHTHDCCPRCRVLLKAPESEFHYESFEASETYQVLWHFPIEPHWWRDEKSEKRRQRIVEDFKLSDLHGILDLVKIHIDDELTDVEAVAQLVRLHRSLSWLNDVADLWFPQFQSCDPKEAMIEYWMLKDAKSIAELAWRYVMELPPRLTERASILAAAQPFELVPTD